MTDFLKQKSEAEMEQRVLMALPVPFQSYYRYVREMKFSQEPDYKWLELLIVSELRKLDVIATPTTPTPKMPYPPIELDLIKVKK